MMFQATARNKRGAILDTAYADTPELAARQIFLRRPSCETVQVCNAYLEDSGRPRGNGSNTHWLKRRELLRDDAAHDAQRREVSQMRKQS